MLRLHYVRRADLRMQLIPIVENIVILTCSPSDQFS